MKRHQMFLTTVMAILWALIVPTVQASATEDNTLVSNNLTAEKGSQIEMTISMNNTAEISSFQFDLELPDNVSIVYDDDEEDYAISLCTTRTTLKRHSLVYDLQEDGSMRIVCTSVSNKTFSGNSGEVVTILLSVNESITSGTYTISLVNIELATPSMVKYNPTDIPIVLTVNGPAALKGDVNEDGFVNVADVTALVSIILGNNYPNNGSTEPTILKGDLNEDGFVNVADVTALVSIILGNK